MTQTSKDDNLAKRVALESRWRYMIFNEHHLVIIDSLNPDEARAFVKFLESEIIRHRDDIIHAQELINRVILKFGEQNV